MQFIQENILLILCALAVLFVIVSLIKKAIKLTIFLVILSFVFGSGGAYIKDLTSRYNLSVSSGVVQYNINGNSGQFNVADVAKVTEEDAGDNKNTKVNIEFKNGSNIGFNVNNTAWKYIVKDKAEKAGMSVSSAE